MGIEVIDIKERQAMRAASPKARAICDECGADEIVTCDYERPAAGQRWTINMGQVRKKLQAKGWVFLKSRCRCATCEAKRKAKPIETTEKEVAEMAEAVREPTKEQRRAIMQLLLECYDTERQLYRGAETDMTVADTVGGNCMFGWVAKIREENFGEGGGNETHGALAAEVAAFRAEVTKAFDRLDDEVRRVVALGDECRKIREAAAPQEAALRQRADSLLAKINALSKTFGPKAERAVENAK